MFTCIAVGRGLVQEVTLNEINLLHFTQSEQCAAAAVDVIHVWGTVTCSLNSGNHYIGHYLDGAICEYHAG